MADPLPHLTTALSDRYRIERELGAGGMATVYLADDLKHGRKVCPGRGGAAGVVPARDSSVG